MTTAKDVASRLNLSVSTVGRALADDDRISAQTKLRVTEIADQLGYVPNRSARMMRGVPSATVGLVVPDVRNSFFTSVAHALSGAMGGEHHQVVLCETGDDGAAELRHVRDLVGAQVVGAIVVPSQRPRPETVRLLRSIPHVQLLRRVSSLSPHSFGIDDAAAVEAATRHLVGLGHRRLAYIGGTTALSTGAARAAGFRAAIAEAGLPPSAGRLQLGPPSSTEQGGVAHGRQALDDLFDSSVPPTGIVTGSIPITRGVLDRVMQRGIEVPEQLSVVGFGDELGFSWWGPGLTTVTMPIHELATACGMWLLERIRNPPTADRPHVSLYSGVVVLRGSTGRPPRASRIPRRR